MPRSLRASARVLLGTFAAWVRAAWYAGSMLLPPRRRPVPDRRHLLLLVRTFPPLVSGGVYRPLALVRAAVAAGWEVTVVTQPLYGERFPVSAG